MASAASRSSPRWSSACRPRASRSSSRPAPASGRSSPTRSTPTPERASAIRGAPTTGYDVRPEVAEQVQSLGAKWLDLGIEAAGEGGYARELTDEEKAQQQQALTDAIKGFDVVITTALVPGRPAPRLVTAEAVEGMKPGSVIVDLAGEAGRNCELNQPREGAVQHR